jgi:glycosyltransferase involved in cell wall biosynthesis
MTELSCKNLKDGVTAVVACHNSETFIEPTIKALLNQKIHDALTFEIIVADNNSSDDTAEKVKNIYKEYKGDINLTIIHEKEAGAAFARKTAVLNASCNIVSFIDDDNILEEDWIQKVYRLFKTKPEVGVIGGFNKAHITGRKPGWFYQFQNSFACGPQARKSSYITDRKFVFGAGASFRTEILLTIYHSSLPLFLSGKKAGAFLLSGNDSELSHRAILMGWELWYEETLVLRHNLSANRLNWKSLCKMQAAHSAALIVLNVYRALIDRKKVKSYYRMFFSVLKSAVGFLLRNLAKGKILNIRREGQWAAISFHHRIGLIKSAFLFHSKYTEIKNQIVAFYKNNNYSKYPHRPVVRSKRKRLKKSGKHPVCFSRVSRWKAAKFMSSVPPDGTININYGKNYKLTALTGIMYNTGFMEVSILWESLEQQKMTYSLAVYVIDSRGEVKFWMRPVFGTHGAVIKPGGFIFGTFEIPKNAVKESQTLGLRLVIPGEDVLKPAGGKRDFHNTRLLIPLSWIKEPAKRRKNTLGIFKPEPLTGIERGRAADITPQKSGYTLITTLYNESDPGRIEEYITCFERNYNHPLINHIHVFYDTLKEDGYSPLLRYLKRKKDVTKIYITGRPTYEHIFRYADRELPESKIIVCNADVFFNETLHLLHPVNLGEKFLVLSRWNILPGPRLHLIRDLFNRPNYLSADAWIFETPMEVDFTCDYELGTMFCDSFLNARLIESGRKVYNPCIDVQACHLHKNWKKTKLNMSKEYSKKNREKRWREERERIGHCPGVGVYWCRVADLEKEPASPYFWEGQTGSDNEPHNQKNPAVRKVGKNIYIKNGSMYCNLTFFMDGDLRNILNVYTLLITASEPRTSYRFGAFIASVDNGTVVSNIRLDDIPRGVYNIDMIINGRGAVSGEYLDTFQLLEPDKEKSNLYISPYVPGTADDEMRALFSDLFSGHYYRHIAAPAVGISKLVKTFSGNNNETPAAGKEILTKPRKHDPAVNGSRCLHGNFSIRECEKRYRPLLDNAKLITWFRDPAERVVSFYETINRESRHILKNNKPDSFARKIIEDQVNLTDFVRFEQSQNLQFKYINPLRPADFHIIGIVEDFEKSLKLLKRMTGIERDLNSGKENTLRVEPEMRELIYKLNPEDLKIYREAVDYFNRLCRENGIC